MSQRQFEWALGPAWLALGLLTGIILAIIFQLWLILFHGFNGDEIHFLALVHDYLRGSLDRPLQTFQVHFFADLAAIPGSESNQLVAGRLAMLAFESTSLVSLYLLARTWSGSTTSVLAVLAFVTMPVTLVHGASFRADPLALAIVLAALAVLARAPVKVPAVLGVGLLVAIAFLVTIKVVLFAPAFAGIAAWRIAMSNDRRRTGIAISAIIGITAVATITLYILHQSTLQAATVAKSGEMLANVGSKTILNAGFWPERTSLAVAAGTAPLHAFLILASIVATLRPRMGSSLERWRNIAILGCLAPMISLFFYRNAFTYFIPTITAPAFVAVAWFLESRKWSLYSQAILAAGLLGTSALSISLLPLKDQSDQRTTIDAVHRIFPQPVPYIDASGMIATFPRQGFFMTGWGMAEYRQRTPIFEARLRELQIPLLLINSSALEHAVGIGESRRGNLLPEDQRVLRENYIQHWGPVWVAGKHLGFSTGEEQTTILIPGPYTVEGGSVNLSGQVYRPGETVLLSRGTHRFAGQPGSKVTLRWGNRLLRPTLQVPGNISRGL